MDISIKTNCVTLPNWLDNYLFNALGAKYCRSNCDMTVIDWNQDMILNYLGTYFPRSYAESYCIFKQYLQTHPFDTKTSINILDFGCGTGGELIGMATAISECCPQIKHLYVKAIDGNRYALNRFDDINDEFNKHHSLQIILNLSAVKIDDFYDLSVLDSIIDSNYDIVISFKAVCEFVTKQQFEEKNAYEYLAKFMLPKLSDEGIMLLVDVTTKNEVAREWIPNLMDTGLKNVNAKIIAKNTGHNTTFNVNHSHILNDTSKVAWRIISNQ